jgi:hypothetical protein
VKAARIVRSAAIADPDPSEARVPNALPVIGAQGVAAGRNPVDGRKVGASIVRAVVLVGTAAVTLVTVAVIAAALSRWPTSTSKS